MENITIFIKVQKKCETKQYIVKRYTYLWYTLKKNKGMMNTELGRGVTSGR